MQNEGRLVLVGGGGHCKSVIDTIKRIGLYDKIVITDPGLKKGDKIFDCDVVGDDSQLQNLYNNGFHKAFITIGFVESSSLRRRLFESMSNIGFDFVNIIEPSAVISEYASLGQGIYVGKNSVVNADAVIGDCAIINNGAIVEHECRVGDFSHIAVGSVLCGQAVVGNDTLIGANSTVLQGKHIGANVIVGAGSIVLSDVGDNRIVYGKVNEEHNK